MNEKPIRVQVPAGASFTAVLAEAAAKVAWRNGFDDAAIETLAHIVGLAATATNTTDPTSVTLELTTASGAISAVIAAVDPTASFAVLALAEVSRAALRATLAYDVDANAAAITLEHAAQITSRP